MTDKTAKNSIRALISSNALWGHSGYSVQIRSLMTRLAELPHINGRENIANFAWYGLQGGLHNVDGFRIYPGGNDAYGNDIIGAHTKDFGANVVITLIDAWVLKDTARKVAPALFCPWAPIDHDPVPQKVLEALEGAHMPLTYSKWGHRMLTDAGVENRYIAHGIEPSVFKVLEDRENVRAFRREVMKNPQHLTVMVAANKGYPDRKAFQVQLRAWANFAKDKPGAQLYVHTEPTTVYGGIDFGELLSNLGISDKVMLPDRYKYFLGYPPEFLSLLYNAADVYLGAAMAEGFGIPIVESQACGTPVIVTDFSSMPELVRWGHAVKPADMFWTPMNAWQAWPDVNGIRDALEELWQQQQDLGGDWSIEARQRTSKLIHDEFSWDTLAAEQWRPLFAELSDYVEEMQAFHANGNGAYARPEMEAPVIRGVAA